MRNWDIAWQEWLFALDVNQDSFNSYPHLRNVEDYLDELVTAPEGARAGGQGAYPLPGSGRQISPFVFSTFCG